MVFVIIRITEFLTLTVIHTGIDKVLSEKSSGLIQSHISVD